MCYLVTCKRCADQYVGETKRQLNHRINGHRSDTKLKKKSLPIVKHFDNCLAKNFEVATIENVTVETATYAKQESRSTVNCYNLK